MRLWTWKRTKRSCLVGTEATGVEEQLMKQLMTMSDNKRNVIKIKHGNSEEFMVKGR